MTVTIVGFRGFANALRTLGAERNMRATPREIGPLWRYGIAVIAAAVAFFFSYYTISIHKSIPWFFFFTAVVVSAWFGGQRASLVTTAILMVLGRYFFVRPLHTLALTTDSLVQTLIFLNGSFFIGYLMSARRRAETYERVERRRFRATVMSIADAVIATDFEGHVSFMNGVAEKLTGWDAVDAEGIPLDEVFVLSNSDTEHTAARDQISGALQALSSTKQRVLTARDGSKRAIEANAAPIKDDRGDATGVVLVFRDIQERTEAENLRRLLTAQLAAQARIFDTALSNAEDFVYTFDLKGRFTYLNHALLSMHRKEADDIIGKNLAELGYPIDLAERLQRQIQQVIDTKTRVSDETPFTSGTGTRFYEYIFVPVLGPSGEVEAVVGSTRDITGRKQVEEATKRRAAQLERLAEIATRISAAHDVDSVVGVVTREACHLIGAKQAATSVVLTLTPPQTVSSIAGAQGRTDEPPAGAIDAHALSESLNSCELPIRFTQKELATDPRWRTLERVVLANPQTNGWVAAPLVDRNHKTMGLLQLADKTDGEFTTEDQAILVQLSRLAAISIENAKLYNELRTNDQRKDEFLAMLAHELRNPLAAIANAVTLATMSGVKEDVEQAMEIIKRQMKHLTRLIDDLLDVSRISRGKIKLVKEVLDATAILESAVATVRPLFDEHKQTLNISLDRGNLWVCADPTRLEQVVVNLLNNAAKFSEKDRKIELVATNDRDDVVLVVRDQGVGIPTAQLRAIFEVFVQGDRSLARSEGGLGIGLTVVKKLVEMHGGNVTARSEGRGKGSEFTIRLPRANRPEASETRRAPVAAHDMTRARILVVDDNIDMVRGISMLLTLKGHDVATAYDGFAALETARGFRPQFVLLDIGLPGMDGYEVASRLRREEVCKDAVIVAVTGYGREEDRRRSKEAGFDYHLIKPVDHKALLSVLSAAGSTL
jgi:PAS domain S-box-containing protein